MTCCEIYDLMVKETPIKNEKQECIIFRTYVGAACTIKSNRDMTITKNENGNEVLKYVSADVYLQTRLLNEAGYFLKLSDAKKIAKIIIESEDFYGLQL